MRGVWHCVYNHQSCWPVKLPAAKLFLFLTINCALFGAIALTSPLALAQNYPSIGNGQTKAQSLPIPKQSVPGFPNVLDNAIEHNRKGTALMTLERYPEAAEHFQAAILLNPYSAMSASLYNNLGIAYQHMGQYALAIASFHHALRIQPDFNVYYQNLIETYRMNNALQNAQNELQEIVEVNPENAEAFYLLGLIYKEQDIPELSHYCFEQFARIKPYSPLATHINKNPVH